MTCPNRKPPSHLRDLLLVTLDMLAMPHYQTANTFHTSDVRDYAATRGIRATYKEISQAFMYVGQPGFRKSDNTRFWKSRTMRGTIRAWIEDHGMEGAKPFESDSENGLFSAFKPKPAT